MFLIHKRPRPCPWALTLFLPPNPGPLGPLTLLLGRDRTPALAPRAAAGLLGGAALGLQVLRRRLGGGSRLRGCWVLPGGLVGFGDLLREVARGGHLPGPPPGHQDQGKPPGCPRVASRACRPERPRPAQGTELEGQGGRSPCKAGCLAPTSPPSPTPGLSGGQSDGDQHTRLCQPQGRQCYQQALCPHRKALAGLESLAQSPGCNWGAEPPPGGVTPAEAGPPRGEGSAGPGESARRPALPKGPHVHNWRVPTLLSKGL